MDSGSYSGSSSESFVSFDGESCQKVEMMAINEINIVSENETNVASSAANLCNHLNSQKDDSDNNKDENLLDIKFTIKWVRLTIVMAFTALFALLSISNITNNGKLQPETIFKQNSYSFIIFLMVLMVAFYFAVNGVIFSKRFPTVTRAFSFVSFIGVVLSFTILLGAFLPQEFSWGPWIFFTFTFGSLLRLCGVYRKRNLKEPDDLHSISSLRS